MPGYQRPSRYNYRADKVREEQSRLRRLSETQDLLNRGDDGFSDHARYGMFAKLGRMLRGGSKVSAPAVETPAADVWERELAKRKADGRS